MKHIFYVLFVLAISSIGLNAQTTLTPGDLGIVGFHSDNPDDVSVVALVDLEVGTAIKFTDNGWLAAGGFRSNEGTMTLTLTQAVGCGDIMYIQFTNPRTAEDANGGSIGTMSGSSPNLSGSGDQILIYQGDDMTPAFVTAINFNNATWQMDATSSNTSALPAGLTEGVNAFGLAETDNGSYNCSTETGDAAPLLFAIYDSQEWNRSNSRGAITSPTCNFTVSDCNGGGGAAGCGTPFFSEYIEGGSNNKCVEIYNPTGAAIDLAADGYAVKRYSNGSASATTINLTGMLAAGDVFVLCHTSSAAAFMAEADQLSGSLSHNGDDALELVNATGTLDIFGRIGNDPGSRWQSANGNDTQNQTLVRNSNIFQGVTANPVGTGQGAFTTLETEWAEFGQDDASFLGSHTFDGCPAPIACSIDGIASINISGCMDNNSISADDDFATLMVEVMFTSPPATGMLMLTGDVNVSIPVGNLGNSPVSIPAMVAADGGPISITASFSAEPTCALSNINTGTAPEACSVVPPCTYPFISEYVEGSGNNKCIEIYNPSPNIVDLSTYKLKFYFNGSTTTFASGVKQLAGALESGSTYVICHTSATDEFKALADQLVGGSWYNGDDAIALTGKIQGIPDTPIDVIGQIGTDPGSGWSAGGVSTRDMTIRRKFAVQAGDNAGTNSFDPSVEWEAYPQNTAFGLSYHVTDCVDNGFPEGWNPSSIDCASAENSYNSATGEWTLSVDCANSSANQDNLAFIFQESCGTTEVIAKVENITGQGKAGVMLRKSQDPGSAYVWLYTQGDGSIHWAIRKFDNQAVQTQVRPPVGTGWLRITRSGFLFKGYVSNDGEIWQPLFQSFVFMPTCMYGGIAATSTSNSVNTTAVFTEVSISGGNMSLIAENNNDAEGTFENNGKIGQNSDLTLPEANSVVDITDVTLRPNPVSTLLTVDLPRGLGETIHLSIIDINGKQVYTSIVAGEEQSIQLDLAKMQLAQGTYLLSLRTDNQVITKRFVKTK